MNLAKQLLSSLRVQTLKNENARFKARIERNEAEILRLTLEASEPEGEAREGQHFTYDDIERLNRKSI